MMSRIGKKPIPLPSGVKVAVSAEAVEVQGPKGKLRQALPPGVLFEVADGELRAKLKDESDPTLGKFHGLARSLVANAVMGVTDGLQEGARHRRRRLSCRAEGPPGGVRARAIRIRSCWTFPKGSTSRSRSRRT